LGLKVETTKGPVEFLVIDGIMRREYDPDRIERPSAN
jgi:hypothetical protein